MKNIQQKNPELIDALFRIKRGLCSYVSYLAACKMNSAFSEYILYEPVLRILNACGYKVECEYECPGIDQQGRGDKKRLDFYANGHSQKFAMEVKWAKSNRLDVTRDLEKLSAFIEAEQNALGLLCVFGRKSLIETIDLGSNLKERGKAVYADLRKTKYGCRIFQLKSS
ncbi:MAG: hypothetical protein HYS25_08295 [Ignavibacteriales bacterium]|nr:hypothetical protein [Ignavibacteriales bacterium]